MLIHNSDWGCMKYSLYLSILLLLPLSARENPFFPADELKKQKVTSNIPDTRPRIGTINYTFPDQARILKEVTFTIQNLDGSFEEKKVQIDQSIDWHRPITLSQGGAVSQPAGAKSSFANFGFVQASTQGKIITIKTSDILTRHFALSDPNRIIIDFKHSGIFKSEQKSLNSAPYSNISIENHGDFARVTIGLDGRYSYVLNNKGGMITITCN
ncbi:MAG: hypothetical protein CJD30_05070 [Sulfuricurvum sp. PD_MW2]|uniref:AMIN domain-containing protein n=1 Tax=Sulfuricurvum sp. PD_MW2 TaxID=2027917 RepID=UPI000C05F300|nr:AMIN domain-containing protein [Sulfuricurvum sp. PD_MW2]PHM17759.1 MAG: hypothetical protein CJD30_05070 [Sulfuricurvum sp. PD_MW2]